MGGKSAASAMVAFRQLGYFPPAQQQIGRVKSCFRTRLRGQEF
jgi:hypothetical protein